MNKRQRKKKEQKYLPIIADEFNMISWTEEEKKEELKKYDQFRERYAYRKKYKDLKHGTFLRYYYPPGQKQQDFFRIMQSFNRSNK